MSNTILGNDFNLVAYGSFYCVYTQTLNKILVESLLTLDFHKFLQQFFITLYLNFHHFIFRKCNLMQFGKRNDGFENSKNSHNRG